MSNTPETDIKASLHIGFFSCATVPADFARQLERERDEARKIAEKLRKERFEARKFASALHEDQILLLMENAKLRDERDEALAEIKRLQKGGCARDQKTTQFCAEAVSAIRERDEARGEAVRYRSLYYQTLNIDRSASWFPWEAKNE
jgi:hypothetical protein